MYVSKLINIQFDSGLYEKNSSSHLCITRRATTMICRVCLTVCLSSEFIPIFGDEGRSLNIAAILGKHFWFQPQADDPISSAVCYYCWIVISNFDEFYRNVQTVQLNYNKQHVRVREKGELAETTQTYETDFGEANDNEALYKFRTENSLLLPEINFAVHGLEEQAIAEENALAEAETGTHKTLHNADTSRGLDEEKELLNDEMANDLDDQSNAPTGQRRGRLKKSFEIEPAETTHVRDESTHSESDSDVGETQHNGRPKRRRRDVDEEIAQFMALRCDICQAKEANFAALRTHMRNEHASSAYVICCNRQFKKRIHLADHIRLHLKPDSFKCEECGKLFASKRSMLNHGLLKHLPDADKQFQCERCPERFAKAYFLDQHRMKHEERNYQCGFCQRSFANPITYKSHLKVYHGEGGIMCDICAKVISGRAAFARHQMEHTGAADPKVQCEQCGCWLKNKVTLRKHMVKHRTNDGVEYKCPICGKLAPHQNALMRHQRNVHFLERRYACTLCKKAFKKALNLKEHMTTHTGEVLYRCPHCPKTFNSNANMHSHRKKVHPVEFEETRRKRMEQFFAPNS